MKRSLTSCFGLGLLPGAPGTFGSLPPMIIFTILSLSSLSQVVISAIMVVLVIAGVFVCVKFGPDIIEKTGKDDPGEIVADEFAGQALTFVGIGSIAGGKIWLAAIIGFVLFRIFDIFKPWPIRKFEKLPKGWGVVADDLMAGVYANIVLQICVRLWFAG